MSLESWAEAMLDKSFFARAVRKSTAKSVVLGWMDAIQNPNAVLSEIAGAHAQAEASTPEKTIPAGAVTPSPPVSLPRPMLLPIPGQPPAEDEDRPGLPPRRVRKKKKHGHSNGQVPPPPANTTPAPGELPE
jgi:hypothetical protein